MSWEMLAAVSNLFGDDAFDGSVYDESLVVRPPKRILHIRSRFGSASRKRDS